MNSWTAEISYASLAMRRVKRGRTELDDVFLPARDLLIILNVQEPSAHPNILRLPSLLVHMGEDAHLPVGTAPVIDQLGHAPTAFDSELLEDLEVFVALGQAVA